MALVVPGTVRYAINGLYEDRPVVNILDMFIDTTGTITERAEAVFDQAGILINQWVNDIMPLMADDYQFTSVSWVDMDSVDGTAGERTQTAAETLPQSAPGIGAGTAGNTAVLVTKVAPGTRQTRNGRLYHAGLVEDDTEATNGNLLTAASLASRQTRWNQFKDNCEQEDIDPTNYQSQFVVTHITARDEDGNPTNGVSRPVTSFAVQQRLATQRRRLRA